MRTNLDWEPFHEIARASAPFAEKLAAYAAIARRRLDADRFAEFKATHLARLPEVAWEFFATPEAKEAVRVKTAALYPAHEVERFTELFWSRIQQWREDAPGGIERDPAGATAPVTAAPPAPAPAPAKKPRKPRAAKAEQA
jgi:hypothetical protein